MEDSLRAASNPGSQPTTTNRTTSKLPAEDTLNNTDTVNSSPELQLAVVEGFQVGRGVARLDAADIARLGCQPGDTILITGARTTAAKVVPSGIVDRGQQAIQMDSQVRQNSASGLGERVTVRKAKVQNAEKVTLLPLTGGAPIQEGDLQYIARYLVGLPVTIGDLIRVGTPGAAPREFLIIGTTPATPSYSVRKRVTGELETLVPPQPQPRHNRGPAPGPQRRALRCPVEVFHTGEFGCPRTRFAVSRAFWPMPRVVPSRREPSCRFCSTG